MIAVLESGPMAKKMGRPKSSVRDDGTARIDRKILNRAQIVAKARKISVAEYLSGVLESPVKRDYLAVIKTVESELD